MDVYRQASEIVSLVRQGHGTAKALSLRKEMQKKKQTYAVVCETLRHYELLEDVLEVAEFFKYYPHANKELALCMAYDVVLGKGVNTQNDSTARAISQSVSYLREAYWRVHKHHIIAPKAPTWDGDDNATVDKNDNNCSSQTSSSLNTQNAHGSEVNSLTNNENNNNNSCNVNAPMPRYARVNTLKIPLETLVERLRRSAENKKRERDSYSYEDNKDNNNNNNNNEKASVPRTNKVTKILPDFSIDKTVPSLLIFPPRTDLHAHPAVKSGQLILQDKASCLPACILLDAVEVLRFSATSTNDSLNVSMNSNVEGVNGNNYEHKKERQKLRSLKASSTSDSNDNNGNNESNATSINRGVERKPLEYVIDACAAPGNKTTHLAALGAPNIKIMAIERDEHRAELLQRRVGSLGASDYVNVVHMDFFDLTSDDRDATEGILLDPSCSASGVMTRVDVMVQHAMQNVKQRSKHNCNSYDNKNKIKSNEFMTEIEEDASITDMENGNGNTDSNVNQFNGNERVKQLSHIQRKMLTHALLSFNNCRTVVYSTCSIHEEENEDVVRHVLCDERVLARGWTLSHIMPHTWSTRGHQAPNETIPLNYTIRCDPAFDRTNGFFVARFDREV